MDGACCFGISLMAYFEFIIHLQTWVLVLKRNPRLILISEIV